MTKTKENCTHSVPKNVNSTMTKLFQDRSFTLSNGNVVCERKVPVSIEECVDSVGLDVACTGPDSAGCLGWQFTSVDMAFKFPNKK